MSKKKKRTISELMKQRKKTRVSNGFDLLGEGDTLAKKDEPPKKISPTPLSKKKPSRINVKSTDSLKNETSFIDDTNIKGTNFDAANFDPSDIDDSIIESLRINLSTKSGFDGLRIDNTFYEVSKIDRSESKELFFGDSKNESSKIDVSKNESSKNKRSKKVLSEIDDSKIKLSNFDISKNEPSEIEVSVNDVPENESSEIDVSKNESSKIDTSINTASTNAYHAKALEELSQLKTQGSTFSMDTQIVDEVLPKLDNTSAFAVYVYLWRRTVGQGRDVVEISTNLMMDEIGLSRGTTQKALELLNQKNLIISTGLKKGGSTPTHQVLKPWRQ